ncbi:hypothetical protein V6C27_11205 [Peptococcaceae bacterium 1198_IL3148]
MGKRSKMAVLGVILLAFVALATKPLWLGEDQENVRVSSVESGQTESSQVSTSQQFSTNAVNTTSSKLAQLLDDSFAKGKPVAVVYTYNDDC